MRQPSMSTTFLRPGVDFEAKPRAEVRRNALGNMALVGPSLANRRAAVMTNRRVGVIDRATKRENIMQWLTSTPVA